MQVCSSRTLKSYFLIYHLLFFFATDSIRDCSDAYATWRTAAKSREPSTRHNFSILCSVSGDAPAHSHCRHTRNSERDDTLYVDGHLVQCINSPLPFLVSSVRNCKPRTTYKSAPAKHSLINQYFILHISKLKQTHKTFPSF